MICLDLNNSKVTESLSKLTRVFKNENIAYVLLAKNNSFSLENNLQGNPSELFNGLKHLYGNATKALKTKAIIYTNEFLATNEWFEKGEPSVTEVLEFLDKQRNNYNTEPVFNDRSVIFIGNNKSTGTKTLTKQNIFSVIPVQAVDKKAITKASIANKFIGFGEGIENSSTELYRKQIGKYANTGNYNNNDTVFVSIGGKRGSETLRNEQQNKTIQEALKAIESGATLITDNKSYIESSTYNEGEKKLYSILKSKGYSYSEQTVDNQVLGVWNKTKFNLTSMYSNIDNALSKGVRAFVMSPIEKATEQELNISEYLLSKGFEYVEKNDTGFYVKEISKVDAIIADEVSDNLITLNNVTIDLRKLGFDFSLTIQQKEFLNKFASWLDGSDSTMDKKHFLLNGYAGTGKSTVIKVAIEYAKTIGKKLVLTATTATAADVQKSIYGDEITTSTLHSALGLRLDGFENQFGDKEQYDNFGGIIKSGDILVIDEASMLNNTLYSKVLQEGVKVLFIADSGQFKPVGMTALSKVFNTSDKVVQNLTKVVRQNENNLLNSTLTLLRTDQETTVDPLKDKRVTKINQETQEGIEYNIGEKHFLESITKFFKSNNYKKVPGFAKILTYFKNSVTSYNKTVRNILGYKSEIEVGEVLTGYKNVHFSKTSMFKNGSDYVVTGSNTKNVTVENPFDESMSVEFPANIVDIKNTLTRETFTVTIMSRSVSQKTKTDLALMYEYIREKIYSFPAGKSRQNAKELFYRFDNSFMTLDDLESTTLKDKYGKPLVVKDKTIDYGYAITFHKSQGSTYQYALVDETGIDWLISKHKDILAANQSRYVAFSRAAKGIVVRSSKQISTDSEFEIQDVDKSVDNISINAENIISLDALVKDGIANKTCK